MQAHGDINHSNPCPATYTPTLLHPRNPTTLALFHLVQIAMALRDSLLLMSSTERPSTLSVCGSARLSVCLFVRVRVFGFNITRGS